MAGSSVTSPTTNVLPRGGTPRPGSKLNIKGRAAALDLAGTVSSVGSTILMRVASPVGSSVSPHGITTFSARVPGFARTISTTHPSGYIITVIDSTVSRPALNNAGSEISVGPVGVAVKVSVGGGTVSDGGAVSVGAAD